MSSPLWHGRILVIAAALSTFNGCAAPGRLPAVPSASTTQADTGLGPVRYHVTREQDSFAAEARNALAKEQQWLSSKGHTGPLPPANFLAISGGGDNGAYGAGFLNGWTEAGTRPEFKVVTGISTGALIAPFAFLGPRYDPVLKRVYTTISSKDIFKSRGLVRGVMGDAMADSRPLARLVGSHVDQPLLDEIAAEYAKGRILLVGTTDLDSLEPVIWNMTAIAASKDPRAVSLFRSILVASASIPGAFPPVMIDVSADGARHQEMHVDGGTMAQVFLYPPSLTLADLGSAATRRRTLYVIRNARLDSEWSDVRRRTMPIASRAIGSLTRTQGIGDLYRIYSVARRDGIDFNLTYIPPTFKAAHPAEFDTRYMQQLYEVGRALAKNRFQWQKYPPGFEPGSLPAAQAQGH